MRDLKFRKPTDEEVGYLQSRMNELLAEEHDVNTMDENYRYINWIVEYYWDDMTRWFAFLQTDQPREERRSLEVVFVPEFGGGEGCCYPSDLEIATHGVPCISNEVWRDPELDERIAWERNSKPKYKIPPKKKKRDEY